MIQMRRPLAILNFHLARNQQGTDFHIRLMLVFPTLGNGLRAALAEILGQRLKEDLVDQPTRSFRRAARCASPTLEAGVLVLLISALRDSPYRPANPNDVFQVCFAKSRGALLASCSVDPRPHRPGAGQYARSIHLMNSTLIPLWTILPSASASQFVRCTQPCDWV